MNLKMKIPAMSELKKFKHNSDSEALLPLNPNMESIKISEVAKQTAP